MDITFLLGSSVVAVLVVQILKDVVGKIEGRFGKLYTQLLLLSVSFAVAGIGSLVGKLPPEILQITGIIFASGMAIYEVVYKALYEKAIKNK